LKILTGDAGVDPPEILRPRTLSWLKGLESSSELVYRDSSDELGCDFVVGGASMIFCCWAGTKLVRIGVDRFRERDTSLGSFFEISIGSEGLMEGMVGCGCLAGSGCSNGC